MQSPSPHVSNLKQFLTCSRSQLPIKLSLELLTLISTELKGRWEHPRILLPVGRFQVYLLMQELWKTQAYRLGPEPHKHGYFTIWIFLIALRPQAKVNKIKLSTMNIPCCQIKVFGMHNECLVHVSKWCHGYGISAFLFTMTMD